MTTPWWPEPGAGQGRPALPRRRRPRRGRVLRPCGSGRRAVPATGSERHRRPSVHVGHQTHQVVRGRGGNDLTTTLDPYRAAAQVLDEREAAAVAEAARRAQARLGSPCAVEWAMVHGQVWILQAAPAGAGSPATHAAGRRLRGRGASAGRVTGPVHTLRRPEGPTTAEPGRVLVVESGGSEWLPALRGAAAVVVDRGGITCGAAVLARENGVPCVVGAGTASSDLHDGDVLTVDGLTGDLALESGGPGSWRADDDR